MKRFEKDEEYQISSIKENAYWLDDYSTLYGNQRQQMVE